MMIFAFISEFLSIYYSPTPSIFHRENAIVTFNSSILVPTVVASEMFRTRPYK